jgi:hypothetical protein
LKKKILLMTFLFVFVTFFSTMALASEVFSSPAAELSYTQFGDLTTSDNPTLLINHIQKNDIKELSYKSSGCSVGCSSGCSVGCSNGCSVGCSNGCSVGCSTGCN